MLSTFDNDAEEVIQELGRRMLLEKKFEAVGERSLSSILESSRLSQSCPRRRNMIVFYSIRSTRSRRLCQKTLLVAYFPREATELDLNCVFTNMAPVARSCILLDHAGNSRCWALVEFMDHSGAEFARNMCLKGKVTLESLETNYTLRLKAWPARRATADCCITCYA